MLEHQYLLSNGYNSYLACHPKSVLFKRARNTPHVWGVSLTQGWRLDNCVRLAWFCYTHKIDIINSHSSKDSALCRLALWLGTPVVRSRQISNPVRHIASYIHGATHIIATAQSIADHLIAQGLPTQRVSVVGEGVDLALFHPHVDSGYLRQEFGLQTDTRVIVNIGMLRPDKGQVYLIEAARLVLQHHPNSVFFIVGSATNTTADFAQSLKQSIVQAGLAGQNHFDWLP